MLLYREIIKSNRQVKWIPCVVNIIYIHFIHPHVISSNLNVCVCVCNVCILCDRKLQAFFFFKYDDVFYSTMETEAYSHLFTQFISTDECDSASANSVIHCVLQSWMIQAAESLYESCSTHSTFLTDPIYYHLTSSLGY